MKLKDLQCKQAKPDKKNYKLRDGKGLYLLVMKSGGKSWRYDYKVKTDEGKFKNGTYVYGLYPEISLGDIREQHKTIHKLVSEGKDPNEYKKEQERLARHNKATTFACVAEEWLEKRKSELRPETIQGIEKRLNVDILPEIGHIPMNKMDAPTILAMIRKVQSRGAFELANKTRQYCSQIFRYAIACGKAERDYTIDISDALAKRRVKHQPALEPNEIHEFLTALDRNDARLYQQTRLAIKMLMLTFVRPIELAAAEWDEFDFNDNRWIIPAKRMKMRSDHVVSLSKQTLEILEEMKPISGKYQYVFIQQRSNKKHMSRDTLSNAIRALGFQGRHTAHGFRAMARTTIREKLNWDSEVIERQLAHAPNTSLGRAYDRTQFIEQRVNMMQDWADYLDGAAKK